MIKGNIILATVSGSELEQLNVSNGSTSKLRGRNLDLYYFIADSDATIITKDSNTAIKIKKGQLFVKSHCLRFYYICSTKTTVCELYNAFIAKQEERLKQEHEGECKVSERCSPSCGDVSAPSNQ